MYKAERSLCDTLVSTRKLFGDVFDDYMIEHVLRGHLTDEDFNRYVKDRLEYLMEERMPFIMRDLEALRDEKEVASNDSSEDASSK